MTKKELINYLYENHVTGDLKIEEMVEDILADDWIPCSKKLPKPHKEVLVTYKFNKHRMVDIASMFEDNEFYSYTDEFATPEFLHNRKCIAWQELPEVYKG